MSDDWARDLSRRLRAATVEALKDVAEDCLREANRTVPLEEGTLARSGLARVDEASLTAMVSYHTPYAVAVHENPTARHDAGRRSHWLQRAVEENQRRYLEHVTTQVKEALR